MKNKLISLITISFLASCNNSSNSNDEKSMDSTKKAKQESSLKVEIVKPEVIIPTVKIGGQEWMTEDIKTAVYNNGEPILEAKKEHKWVEYGAKKVGCYRILKNGTYVYNGYAVNDKRGIIPAGFILPSESQFKKLIKFLGAGDREKAEKSLATYNYFVEEWVGEGEEGSLEDVEIKSNGKSGFNAKKGGFVYDHGALDNEGDCSYWWTSSKYGESASVVDIGYCSQDLGGGIGGYSFAFGFAVRGIKSN